MGFREIVMIFPLFKCPIVAAEQMQFFLQVVIIFLCRLPLIAAVLV